MERPNSNVSFVLLLISNVQTSKLIGFPTIAMFVTVNLIGIGQYRSRIFFYYFVGRRTFFYFLLFVKAQINRERAVGSLSPDGGRGRGGGGRTHFLLLRIKLNRPPFPPPG